MIHRTQPQRFVLFAFLPWFTFWSQGGSELPDLARITVALGTAPKCSSIKKTFQATLAHTNQSRSRGLGGRATPLSASEGMLFVFDRPEKVNFWMKDTLIPLEIAYFDSKSRLVEVLEMPVEADPKQPLHQYLSKNTVIAALEVAPESLKGFAKNADLILCADTLQSR